MRALCLAVLVAATGLPASAAMISRIGDADICGLMSVIGRETAVMRQAGLNQGEAAQRMGGQIGSALSNRSGSGAARQRLASLLGGEATGILRLVYSVPVGSTDAERVEWVASAERYVYGYCMGLID